MSRGALYSAGIHAILMMLAYIGLPDFLKRDTVYDPMVIAVDILPISEMTNLPKSMSKPKKDKKKEKLPKMEPKKKPKPKNKPKPKPKPKTKENPVKTPPKPKDKPKKPEAKKPQKPKEDTKKADKKAADASEKEVLKDKAKAKDEQSGDADKKPEDGQSLAENHKAYDEALPMSLSEKDAIISQFYKCWRMPAGAANDFELQVLLKVKVREDGYVTQVDLDESMHSKYASDSFYRAAVDSAMRAVQKCNPITGLPPEKYLTWKDMELNFDPSQMLY